MEGPGDANVGAVGGGGGGIVGIVKGSSNDASSLTKGRYGARRGTSGRGGEGASSFSHTSPPPWEYVLTHRAPYT